MVTRCLSCMKEIEGAVCPHCGYPKDMQNAGHQLPVGTLLRGRYQLGRVLGQGGFGITYLAWDTLMNTRVAVKEFFPNGTVFRDCTESTQIRCITQDKIPHYEYSKERFLREAKALVQFRDIPEIVDILGFVEENNTGYIVMEFVRGVDLARYVQLRGGKLSADETLRLLCPVMETLAQVHRAGIIHRDISPDNIILDPMGGAKLLDFGAVRTVENPDVDSALPKSTESILKHGFAPMEQYNRRGSLGPWTDEYAMCATIWYCLTGKIPDEPTMRMTEGIDPDWSTIPGLTRQQQKALAKGLSCRPKDRFADMDSLLKAMFPKPTGKKEPPKQENPGEKPRKTSRFARKTAEEKKPEPVAASQKQKAAPEQKPAEAEKAPVEELQAPAEAQKPEKKETRAEKAKTEKKKPKEKEEAEKQEAAVKQGEAEKKEPAVKRSEAEKTQAEIKKPESEEPVPEKKEDAPQNVAAAKKKPRAGKKTLLAAAAVIVLAVLAVVFVVPSSANRYDEACVLMENGEYAQAAEIFESLEAYKDSAALAQECRYKEAQKLMLNAQYQEAAVIFESLEAYKDSAALAENCRMELEYIRANELMGLEQYSDAAPVFEALGSFKDSADKAEECRLGIRYLEAEAYLEAGDYYRAATGFYSANGFRDAWERSVACWGYFHPHSIATGYNQTFAIKRDGTVVSASASGSMQWEARLWEDIVSISVGTSHAVGIRADGSVVVAGINSESECKGPAWQDIIAVSVSQGEVVALKVDGSVVVSSRAYNLSGWQDIVEVSTESSHVVGLRSDGTVLAKGWNKFGQCDVSNWSNIVSVSAGYLHTVGLKEDGTVIAVGESESGECDVTDWEGIVAVSAGWNHTVGLKADGTVVAVGWNGHGQCDVSDWQDIVAIDAGPYHTVGLKADGTVVAVGRNDYGQCNVSGWTDIRVPQ